jgi:hypothetical protein
VPHKIIFVVVLLYGWHGGDENCLPPTKKLHQKCDQGTPIEPLTLSESLLEADIYSQICQAWR